VVTETGGRQAGRQAEQGYVGLGEDARRRWIGLSLAGPYIGRDGRYKRAAVGGGSARGSSLDVSVYVGDASRGLLGAPAGLCW
jgi:hypothetical protein